MRIGDALAAACLDDDVLARLGGPLGETARAKAAAYREAPTGASKYARALASAVAHGPVLAGVRHIDKSWIEAALVDLPKRARGDLARGGTAMGRERVFDPVAVWCARWAAAALAPLAAPEPIRPAAISDVPRLGTGALHAWLASVGSDQLAHALGRAATRFVGAAVVERISAEPRAGELGARRAAIARCKIVLEQLQDGLAVIGARAIAPHTDA
ncbi:MAG TPA: hypothetical protein VK427_11865, partial [Kofleriaceae bacterium]|nr:hypothetical protein [Kofleriaceae bacterium]